MSANTHTILEWLRIILYITWIYSLAVLAIRELKNGNHDGFRVIIAVDCVFFVFLTALILRSIYPQINTGAIFDYVLTPVLFIGIFIIWRVMFSDERNGVEELEEKLNGNSPENKGVW